MIEINDRIAIDEREVEISYQRASGPGGQNVNKVETAVTLRFDARRSPSLPNDVALRVMAAAGQRLTNDGVVVIQAQRFRSQERNKADAIERLVELIRMAATPPKPRRATKVPKGQKEERIRSKKTRSTVKAMRGKVTGD